MPDVTVIVIACDVREEVLSCLASVQEHTGALDVEVILVDNGSRDGTAEAVRSRCPGVEVVRRETNEGVPARNHGLRRARGRHRMFLDSDARLTPGALETLVEVLDTTPEAGLVAPRLEYPSGELQPSIRRFPPLALPLLRRPPLNRFFEDGRTVRHHLMADDPHDRSRRIEYALGACQLFRADAQAAAGEIDPRIHFGPDDADWCLRIREAGFDVLYVPEAIVVHDYRRSSNATPLSRVALRHLAAFLYFQSKWRRRGAALRAEGTAMDAEAALGASEPAIVVGARSAA
ncbi:MAG: glycosyltransferase family 2 protein [Solirubrobacteraceae bacterium]